MTLSAVASRAHSRGKTSRCRPDWAIRHRHRQAGVSTDDIPPALETSYQIDVLTGFQRGESAHAPVGVGAASEVGSADVIMAWFYGTVVRQILRCDDRWVMPPDRDVYHPENHVGTRRDLA